MLHIVGILVNSPAPFDDLIDRIIQLFLVLVSYLIHHFVEIFEPVPSAQNMRYEGMMHCEGQRRFRIVSDERYKDIQDT